MWYRSVASCLSCVNTVIMYSMWMRVLHFTRLQSCATCFFLYIAAYCALSCFSHHYSPSDTQFDLSFLLPSAWYFTGCQSTTTGLLPCMRWLYITTHESVVTQDLGLWVIFFKLLCKALINTVLRRYRLHIYLYIYIYLYITSPMQTNWVMWDEATGQIWPLTCSWTFAILGSSYQRDGLSFIRYCHSKKSELVFVNLPSHMYSGTFLPSFHCEDGHDKYHYMVCIWNPLGTRLLQKDF